MKIVDLATGAVRAVAPIRALDTATVRITPGEGRAAYVDPGRLLYARDGALLSQPFDLASSQFTGAPTVLEPNIVQTVGSYRAVRFSVTNNGRLVTRTADRGIATQLTRFNRAGKPLGTIGEPAQYTNPDLSPDGKRLAVGIADPRLGARDIWILDVAGGTKTRFTFHAADDMNPSWSPDGRRIAFSSDRKGARDLYVKPADGSGDEALLLASSELKNVEQWIPDGSGLLFNVGSIGLSTLRFDRKTPEVLINGPATEVQGRISPDGRWFAYTSDESGRPEVFVRSLRGRGVWQVSNGGGTVAQWRGDGRELFFRSGREGLMVAPITVAGESLKIGTPRLLFQVRMAPTFRNPYVVTPDGETFIVQVLPETESAVAPLIVVTNRQAAFGVRPSR